MREYYNVEAYIADRERLKKTNPVLYFLTGGDKSTEYNRKNLEALNKAKGAGETIAEVGGAVVGGTFDFIVWVRENWQLAVLGLVALLILLKD